MLQLENADQVMGLLEQGALLLCPNHQLAVALQESYGVWRQRTERPLICATPRIQAIDMWLRQQWQQLNHSASALSAGRQVLSAGQESQLWHQVIRNSSVGDSLLNPQTTARLASEAYTLMLQYGLDREALQDWLQREWQVDERRLDISHFLQWHREFDERLAERHLLSLSQTLEALTDAVNSRVIPVPTTVLTFAFNSPPPLYQGLLTALSSVSQCQPVALTTMEPDYRLAACDSALGEIHAAVAWASDLRQRHPEARIAILSPALHEQGAIFKRLFSARLPATDISLGGSESLYDQPLIARALALLNLADEQIDTLSLCQLLQADWLLPDSDEISARSALERRLRDQGERLTALSTLRALCHQKERAWYCPVLGKALQDVTEMGRRPPAAPHEPGSWLALIQQQLQTLGWPLARDWKQGEAAWQRLLDESLQAALVSGIRSYRPCRQLLTRLAGQLQTPQKHYTAPIRLLQPEAAENLQFTHLWLMRMGENNWPPARRQNPFIPPVLQKSMGMPLPDRDSHFAWHRYLLQRLASNASEQLVFSHARREDDTENPPAALLAQWTLRALDLPTVAADSGLHPDTITQLGTATLDCHEESALLPLEEGDSPRGGSSIIKHQAECPFRAFAIHRLGAELSREPGPGLSPMVVGRLMHRALELLWDQLEDHATLLALSEEEALALCRQASAQALSEMRRDYPGILQARFTAVEQERLISLLLRWLDVDRQRPFTRILEKECRIEWQHGPLHLRLQLDRVEEHEDQSLAIVDYKSGRRFTLRWHDPRPQEPQILLYLLAAQAHFSERDVSALLLAFVDNDGKPEFQGRSARPSPYRGLFIEEDQHPEALNDWQALVARWRQSVEQLADEFIQGLCTVTPTTPATCSRCHLAAACRIADLQTAEGGEDDEDSPESNQD